MTDQIFKMFPNVLVHKEEGGGGGGRVVGGGEREGGKGDRQWRIKAPPCSLSVGI